MLDVRHRLCVVVGAGAVGMRKVARLRRAGAKVRLVAPPTGGEGEDFTGPPPAGVDVVRARYEPGQLAGALLVFACTDDAGVNRRVADDARRAGALVNVADDPEACDFLAPAVIEEGRVQVAIGTGGACPALAGALRRRLREHLPERIADFAEALASIRRELLARGGGRPGRARRRNLLKRLAGRAGYNAFISGGVEGLRRLAQAEADRSDATEGAEAP